MWPYCGHFQLHVHFGPLNRIGICRLGGRWDIPDIFTSFNIKSRDAKGARGQSEIGLHELL
jgi:hypothetical protein